MFLNNGDYLMKLVFTPLKDIQMYRSKVINDGDYVAIIDSEEVCLSRAGNPQLVVKMTLKDIEPGRDWDYTAYLTVGNAFEYITKAYCYVTGKRDMYDNGEVESGNWVDKKVIVTMKCRNDKDGKAESKALNFMPYDLKLKTSAPKPQEEPFLDDPLPF
jgi:hypothetical protein